MHFFAGMVASMGWMGVDIFFALSGFLITGILLRCERDAGGLRNFYIKRALRIWPLYYCLLALFCCELVWTRAPYPVFRCAVFVQNYLPQFAHPHNFDQTWSLCVEEHIYLVWPILVLFLPRASLPWLLLSVLAGCPALRWAAVQHGVSAKLIYTASQYRLDSIALGSLLACLRQAEPLVVQPGPAQECWNGRSRRERSRTDLVLAPIAWEFRQFTGVSVFGAGFRKQPVRGPDLGGHMGRRGSRRWPAALRREDQLRTLHDPSICVRRGQQESPKFGRAGRGGCVVVCAGRAFLALYGTPGPGMENRAPLQRRGKSSTDQRKAFRKPPGPGMC